MVLPEDLLCVLLLLPLLVVHIIFIYFEVWVIADLGKPPGLCLAMLDDQMSSKPITSVETEAWVEIFHLLIVSEQKINSCDWTYLFDNKAILSRAKCKVVAEGLGGVEVAIAQVVSRSLGEIESMRSTAKLIRKLTI